MGAEIAAGDRTRQQHRQPDPGDLALLPQGDGPGPVPEQSHQNQGVGHSPAVIQPKPAHQPERDKQASA